MNADLSIHRMAFREAESLGLAQAMVVKKRQELELRLQRERVLQGSAPTGQALDDALRRMDEEHAQPVTLRQQSKGGTIVDKTA